MKDSIAILLSTYNGEQYLEEQIDSILNQDYTNWVLYIRDDGSIDSTLDIIKRYSQQYNNIHYIENNDNKGVVFSFMHLLQVVDYGYYMFCDQDDIWLQNKISSVYKLLKENEDQSNVAVLVFSDAKVVDQNLNIIDESFWNYNKTPPSLILNYPKYISIFNCAPGCTMMFNNEVKKNLNDYDQNIIMHDWYIMIKALSTGVVKYVNQPLMLYRQHNTNVVGASEISIISRFVKIFNIKDSFRLQISVFRFVKKYTSINIFEFYKLKLKFNFLRFRMF